MKKFSFFSILCLMFAFIANTTSAQTPCTLPTLNGLFAEFPKPADPGGCCFYLEQIETGQIISPWGDTNFEKFNLNPIVPGVNNGKVEYYYFRFKGCDDGSNPLRGKLVGIAVIHCAIVR